MNFFLILFCLFASNAALEYGFTDVVIKTEIYSTSKISSSVRDTCWKMIVRNQHVYHLNEQDKYQSWKKNNLNAPETDLALDRLSPLFDFDANEELKKLVFFYVLDDSTSRVIVYNEDKISLQYQGNQNILNLTLNFTPRQILLMAILLISFIKHQS